MQEAVEGPELYAAIRAARPEFGSIVKSSSNDHFNHKYANLTQTLAAVEPALEKWGMMLLQPTIVGEDGRMVLVTRLIHIESGQEYRSYWKLNPIKNDPQMEGSALTYARRYQIQSMFNLVAEDDDGHTASHEPPPPPAKDFAAEIAAISTKDQGTALWNKLRESGELNEEVKAKIRERVATIGDGISRSSDEAPS